MNQKVKPYQCEICKKWYASIQTLQNHLKLHPETRDRTFPCSLCDKSCYTLQMLQQHEKLHNAGKEHQCDVCSKSFTTSYYLKNHFKAVHSGYRPFICEVCDKTFARKAELENHIRIHTGERPFECDECHQTFNQRSNLQTHVRTTHKGEKRYQCPECQMSFKRRRLLTYHIYAKHMEEKPLKCTYCDKGFVYPQLFKRHMLICKSRPQNEFYMWTNLEGEQYLVNRIGSNYYVVNTDDQFDVLDAHLKQSSSADFQDINNKIIPDDCQESKVPLQPSHDILQDEIDTSYPPDNKELVQIISSNDSALDEPNSHIFQEVIATQLQEQNELFEVDINDQNGLWYSPEYDNEKYTDI